MKIKFFFILFPLFLSSLLFSQSASVSSLENHIWRNSIGGGLITGIQIGPEAAFVLGDNKALQVYHRNGNLLWRTYFSGEVEPFLYVSKRFFSFVVVKRAGHYYLNAINRGGKIVWEQEIPGKVVFHPAEGKDGRLIFPLNDKLICLSLNGTKKWQVTLPSSPVNMPVKINDTSIMIPLKNGDVYHINQFGGIIDIISTGTSIFQIVGAVSDKENAIYVSTNGGLVKYSSVNGQWIREWEMPLTDEPVQIVPVQDDCNGILLQNGTLLVFNSTGEVLKQINSEKIEVNKLKIQGVEPLRYENKSWYINTGSAIYAFSVSGEQRWCFRKKNNQGVPVLSQEGDIYTADSGWILYAYRAETRIQSPTPLLDYSETEYGFSTVKSSRYGTWFSASSAVIQSDLERIKNRFDTGYGDFSESEDIRRLIEIATDDCDDQSGAVVNVSDRWDACLLLGESGSGDAKKCLLNILNRDADSHVREAAIRGLGLYKLDLDNTMMDAFAKYLYSSRTTKSDSELKALCETIGSVCDFMGSPVAEKGIKLLSAMNNLPFNDVVRKKASEILQNLAQ